MSNTSNNDQFPLDKRNFIIMAVGVFMVIIGFILMSGGKSPSPAEFNPEIFNFQRITLAPTVVILGFAVVMYSIFAKGE